MEIGPPATTPSPHPGDRVCRQTGEGWTGRPTTRSPEHKTEPPELPFGGLRFSRVSRFDPERRRRAQRDTLCHVGCLHHYLEGIRVHNSQVGQHLAVHLDPSLVQPADQLAVGRAVLASGGVDAGDPEGSEVALLLSTVAIGVLAGAGDGVGRGADQLAASAAIALRLLEDLLTSPA